jgi:hypothetical protein
MLPYSSGRTDGCITVAILSRVPVSGGEKPSSLARRDREAARLAPAELQPTMKLAAGFACSS